MGIDFATSRACAQALPASSKFLDLSSTSSSAKPFLHHGARVIRRLGIEVQVRHGHQLAGAIQKTLLVGRLHERQLCRFVFLLTVQGEKPAPNTASSGNK